MNVEGFLNAKWAYDDWVASHSNASASQKEEAYNVSKSKSFENWITINPNGTLEQYISIMKQQQAYYNSPNYKIDALEYQINTQLETIQSLENQIKNLKKELSYAEDDNETLSSNNSILIATSIFFIIISLFLSVIVYKRTNFFNSIINKLLKRT